MAPIIDGRNIPASNATKAMREVASQLRSIADGPSHEKSLSDYAVDSYDEIKWDLDQIQAVLTPWAIRSHADQIIVDALIQFDGVRRQFHNAIISHKLIVTGTPYPALVLLVEASADLYETISQSWHPA
jgi:hypothetical protein